MESNIETEEKATTRNRDYKKVRLEGGSVTLTMGKLVPKEWELVKLVEVERDEDSDTPYVTVRIEKVR